MVMIAATGEPLRPPRFQPTSRISRVSNNNIRLAVMHEDMQDNLKRLDFVSNHWVVDSIQVRLCI